jgi:hypothetical protein
VSDTSLFGYARKHPGKVRRQRDSRYSWAEVSAWLASARLGEVDHAAAAAARACALVNAALAVRAGMGQLPAHDRSLLARFVGLAGGAG